MAIIGDASLDYKGLLLRMMALSRAQHAEPYACKDLLFGRAYKGLN